MIIIIIDLVAKKAKLVGRWGNALLYKTIRPMSIVNARGHLIKSLSQPLPNRVSAWKKILVMMINNKDNNVDENSFMDSSPKLR